MSNSFTMSGGNQRTAHAIEKPWPRLKYEWPQPAWAARRISDMGSPLLALSQPTGDVPPNELRREMCPDRRTLAQPSGDVTPNELPLSWAAPFSARGLPSRVGTPARRWRRHVLKTRARSCQARLERAPHLQSFPSRAVPACR